MKIICERNGPYIYKRITKICKQFLTDNIDNVVANRELIGGVDYAKLYVDESMSKLERMRNGKLQICSETRN